MKKCTIKAEENDMNDSVEKFDRKVEVQHYTVKGKARMYCCQMTLTSEGKTIIDAGDTVCKDVKEAKFLRCRAEAVAYARCLAKLADALEEDTKSNSDGGNSNG